MRPIDGDALLKQMKHRKEYVGRLSDPVCLVEDAPTINTDTDVRMMTLDELTEIYVEFKGTASPIRLIHFDLQKIITYADDGICRLWTGMPTNEQMKEAKWDAETSA